MIKLTVEDTTSQLIKEQIQEDVITYMDGFTSPFTFTYKNKQSITDDICDIVVANFKLSKNNAESVCV